MNIKVNDIVAISENTEFVVFHVGKKSAICKHTTAVNALILNWEMNHKGTFVTLHHPERKSTMKIAEPHLKFVMPYATKFGYFLSE